MRSVLFTALALAAPALVLAQDTCSGQIYQNYCCPGKVLNQASFGTANAICCVGDSSLGLLQAITATACTSGTATPLTALPSTDVSSLATLISPTSTTLGAGQTMTLLTTTTSAATVSETSSHSTSTAVAAATSTTSTSTGAAARMMITGLPVAGALLGALAAL